MYAFSQVYFILKWCEPLFVMYITCKALPTFVEQLRSQRNQCSLICSSITCMATWRTAKEYVFFLLRAVQTKIRFCNVHVEV